MMATALRLRTSGIFVALGFALFVVGVTGGNGLWASHVESMLSDPRGEEATLSLQLFCESPMSFLGALVPLGVAFLTLGLAPSDSWPIHAGCVLFSAACLYLSGFSVVQAHWLYNAYADYFSAQADVNTTSNAANSSIGPAPSNPLEALPLMPLIIGYFLALVTIVPILV